MVSPRLLFTPWLAATTLVRSHQQRSASMMWRLEDSKQHEYFGGLRNVPSSRDVFAASAAVAWTDCSLFWLVLLLRKTKQIGNGPWNILTISLLWFFFFFSSALQKHGRFLSRIVLKIVHWALKVCPECGAQCGCWRDEKQRSVSLAPWWGANLQFAILWKVRKH